MKNFKKVLLLTILCLSMMVATGCKSFCADIFHPIGKFVKTGDMTISRMSHSATLLQDGRVLITGGWSGDVDGNYTSSAEIYNPKTGQFTKIPDMTERRSRHTSTLLKDGRVLITGGSIPSPYDIASAEIYDPKTNTFTKTGDMNLGRSGHAAILLNNGKVLIVGGSFSLKPPIPPKTDLSIKSPEFKKHMHYAELYDPATGEFTFTPESKGWYIYPVLTLLPNGRVLIVGDSKGQIAEIYDSEKNEFIQVGETTKPFYETTSILLNNNKVLIAGSAQDNYADLYDIKTGKFKASRGKLHSIYYNNAGATSTLLNNGKALIIGTYTNNGYENLYNPRLDLFFKTPNLGNAVGNHTATLLTNGDVLITGGGCKDKKYKNSGKTLKEAELYKY